MSHFRICPPDDYTRELLEKLAQCLQAMPPDCQFVIEGGNDFYGPDPMQTICEHASRLDWLMANMREGSVINLGNGIVIRPGEDIATWVEKIDSAKEE